METRIQGMATLQELGDKYGMSRERARQIEKRAFKKIGVDRPKCSRKSRSSK